MSSNFSNLKRNIEQKRKKLKMEHPEIYESLSDVPNVEKNSEGKTILKNYLSTIGRLLHTHPRKRYLHI